MSGTLAGDFIEDLFGGLRIVDVSDPMASVEVGTLDTSGFFPGASLPRPRFPLKRPGRLL